RAGPPSGLAEAVRYDHAAAMEKGRYRASRVLDRGDRAVEPGPLLPAQMGIARRAREKVRCVPGQSGVDRRARRDREERPDRRVDHQYDSAADQLFVGEVTKREVTTCSTSSASITACRAA